MDMQTFTLVEAWDKKGNHYLTRKGWAVEQGLSLTKPSGCGEGGPTGTHTPGQAGSTPAPATNGAKAAETECELDGDQNPKGTPPKGTTEPPKDAKPAKK